MTTFAEKAAMAAAHEHLAAVREWIAGGTRTHHRMRRTWKELRRLTTGGLAIRPERSPEPYAELIAYYWGRGVCCWRCGAIGPIDRAHMVDRGRGGLDDFQNLGLLCRPCHQAMPSFGGEDALAARNYVLGLPAVPLSQAVPNSKDSLLAQLFPAPGTEILSQRRESPGHSVVPCPYREGRLGQGPQPLPLSRPSR